MSALFSIADYSQEICEICELPVAMTEDLRAKPHRCSMRRLLRMRHRRGATEPLVVSTFKPIPTSTDALNKTINEVRGKSYAA